MVNSSKGWFCKRNRVMGIFFGLGDIGSWAGFWDWGSGACGAGPGGEIGRAGGGDSADDVGDLF